MNPQTLSSEPLRPLLGVFFLTCMALGLTGCASRLAPPADTEAVVYVMNTIPVRGGAPHALLVDGEQVARLKPQHYTWFELSRGTYELKVYGKEGQGRLQSAVEVVLKPGQTRFFVYDEHRRDNYLYEYGEPHAYEWLADARYVSSSLPR